MKVCPFDDERACPLPHRKRSDRACVACQLAALAKELKKELGAEIVWVFPVNRPSIAQLVDADKRFKKELER